MSDMALLSACDRILLDGAVTGPDGDLAALATRLRDRLAGRELRLLHAGGEPSAHQGSGIFDAVLEGAKGDEGLQALAAAQANGDLEGSLLVTASERLVAWARQQGVAVLSVSVGDELPERLSLPQLALRDTAALILRSKRRKEERPFLVGINGIGKSGKTRFSERLAEQLRELGFQAELLSLDIFTAQKKTRKPKGYSEAEGFYYKHYDMDRLQEQLLRPLQGEQSPTLQLDLFDTAKDKIAEKRSLALDRRSMVLLEGPFLFQEEFFAFFDFRIYLVTDFEKSLELELRGFEGKDREKRKDEFIRRELAAQSIYLKQETPWKRAQLVLRGVNSETPSIESWQRDA